MELYLVLGGPVVGERARRFDPDALDVIGLFGDYNEAEDAWRSASQKSVDDAETRYLILPLHLLIDRMLNLELGKATLV